MNRAPEEKNAPEDVTHVFIPNTVTHIHDYAFSGCEKLVSVIFEEDSKLEVIHQFAFAGCKSLRNLKLPDGLKVIEECAFAGCTALIYLKLPNNLKGIFTLINLTFIF